MHLRMTTSSEPNESISDTRTPCGARTFGSNREDEAYSRRLARGGPKEQRATTYSSATTRPSPNKLAQRAVLHKLVIDGHPEDRPRNFGRPAGRAGVGLQDADLGRADVTEGVEVGC